MRYAKPITKDELEQVLRAKTKEVIESYGKRYDGDEILSSPLMRLIPESDLTIEFDCENEVYFRLHQMNGFVVALWQVGGDWEVPMYFAMYIDEEDNLRVYVPTYGNVFNIYTMTAFGSETSAAGQPMPKSMPEGLREGYSDDDDEDDDECYKDDDDYYYSDDDLEDDNNNNNNNNEDHDDDNDEDDETDDDYNDDNEETDDDYENDYENDDYHDYDYDDEEKTEYEKYLERVENSENISYILADIAANICVRGQDIIPLPEDITFPYYKGIKPQDVKQKQKQKQRKSS